MMIFTGFVNIQIGQLKVHFVFYIHFVLSHSAHMFNMCYKACKFRQKGSFWAYFSQIYAIIALFK